MIYPLKITKHPRAPQAFSAHKNNFFQDFLSEIFYMTQVETYRRFFKIPMTGTAIQGPFRFKKLQTREQ